MIAVKRWAIRWRGLLAASTVGVATASALSLACTSAHDDGAADQAADVTELDKVEWLDKAAKVLRNGDGLGPRDDVARLSAMTKEEVIDLWMADPRFGDAVLAFNLYYLNRGIEQVKRRTGNGYTYDNTIFDFPQAVLSARAVLEDGDYFSIFASTPPLFSAPPATGTSLSRATVMADMTSAIDAVATTRPEACQRYAQAGLTATNALRLLGFSPAIKIRQRWLNPVNAKCTDPTGTSGEVQASMRVVAAAIDRIWAQSEAPSSAVEVQSIRDLRSISANVPELPELYPTLGDTFFRALPVSSTNFQRKRSAFMLKTYFCDDLTPLSIPSETPTEDAGADGSAGDGGTDTHTNGNAHASNPTCQACHYRLDPMGALFRNIGAGGADFTGAGKIQFDDNVTFSGTDLDRYLSQWQNPDGSWRAGYYVIGRDGKPERERAWLDSDGDTLKGLWSYLPRSKVAKSCLTRKLASFVLGAGQVYDREWLGQISADFTPGPGSAKGFKEVVKALLLSTTFGLHDPKAGTCYDLPTGAGPNRSPCAIAHVVSENCAGCHASVDGPGHLDFTQWRDIGDGVFSWAHLDANGAQLPRDESLRRILARITASDPNVRMPLLRAMSEDDHKTLRIWITSTLEGR